MTLSSLFDLQQRFVNQFASQSDWVFQTREQGIECLKKHGFPNRTHEEWKYTSLRPVLDFPWAEAFVAVQDHPVSSDAHEKIGSLLSSIKGPCIVFIDGLYRAEFSQGLETVKGLKVRSINTLSTKVFSEPLAWNGHPFLALNQAFSGSGVAIEIEKNACIDSIIRVMHVRLTPKAMSAPRISVKLLPRAEAKIIESSYSFVDEATLSAGFTDLFLDEGSQLQFNKIQDEKEAVLQGNLTFAQLMKDSRFFHYAHMQGGRLTRNDCLIELLGEGAEVTLDGLYLAREKEHIDNHTIIEHKIGKTVSSQIYKGLLKDQSRAVFNGRVVVHEGAQETNARQLNRNLLLSDEAEVDTKPELLIDANDVKCSHGATIGQLRSDELFYLESRGLTRSDAMRMLSAAFADELVLKLPEESLKKHLRSLTKEWLKR